MSRTHPRDVPLPPPGEETLTRLEACRVARVSESTFDRAVANKRISVRRLGLRILIKRAELDRWIETLPTERAARE
jgi:excisionase family DNA binding protein